jgi:hypothetical protein
MRQITSGLTVCAQCQYETAIRLSQAKTPNHVHSDDASLGGIEDAWTQHLDVHVWLEQYHRTDGEVSFENNDVVGAL